MLCGGDVEVFLEPLHAEDSDLSNLCRRILAITKQGGAGVVVTRLDPESWQHAQIPKLLVEKTGEGIEAPPGGSELEASVREHMERLLTSRLPAVLSFEEGGSKGEVFVEALISDPVLYIFGGGHVSQKIVPFASTVGFRVVVIDDREEFASVKQFPHAHEVHRYPFAGVLERLPVDEFSYIVIVTRGHIHDKTVLEQSLRTSAGYVGMIGSRRKRNMIYESLMKEGFTKEDISRVHAPIGLDIGAETPEEIAVSVVAELIQVRAGKEK
jgi:xanthine dehydrogenase accessory factor